MPEVSTTLVSSETKSGNSQKGPWHFTIYQDAAGQKYQTDFNESFEVAFGSPVTVAYEEVQRGDFTNKVISAILPAGNQQESSGSNNGSEPLRNEMVASGGRSDDVAGKIRTFIASGLAGAMFSALPAEEQTFESAKAIGSKLVQWCLDDGIPL